MNAATEVVAALTAEVAEHKAAIRRHRAMLSRAKAALVSMECGLRGIRYVVAGEGKESHGRDEEEGAGPRP